MSEVATFNFQPFDVVIREGAVELTSQNGQVLLIDTTTTAGPSTQM
jgi:hypothetical protein